MIQQVYFPKAGEIFAPSLSLSHILFCLPIRFLEADYLITLSLCLGNTVDRMPSESIWYYPPLPPQKGGVLVSTYISLNPASLDTFRWAPMIVLRDLFTTVKFHVGRGKRAFHVINCIPCCCKNAPLSTLMSALHLHLDKDSTTHALTLLMAQGSGLLIYLG